MLFRSYYNLAKPFVGTLSLANPARGLNLFSAVWGAIAVMLLTGFAAAVTNSLGVGVAAGLMLAFSYTFWTQAIIAEVYTLNLGLVALCLLMLAHYARRPTLGRLAIFFAVYAVSFGNHLSMILLFIPFTVFIVMATPDWRSLVAPRTSRAGPRKPRQERRRALAVSSARSLASLRAGAPWRRSRASGRCSRSSPLSSSSPRRPGAASWPKQRLPA